MFELIWHVLTQVLPRNCGWIIIPVSHARNIGQYLLNTTKECRKLYFLRYIIIGKGMSYSNSNMRFRTDRRYLLWKDWDNMLYYFHLMHSSLKEYLPLSSSVRDVLQNCLSLDCELKSEIMICIWPSILLLRKRPPICRNIKVECGR